MSKMVNGFLLYCLLSVSSVCLPASAIAGSVTYKYDALGRVTAVLYPNGTCNIYSYDAAGNRTQYSSTSPSAPVAAPVGLTVLQNLASSFDPRGGQSACGGSITVSSVTAPAHGTAVIGAGGTSITYTPASGYTGPDSFTYTLYNSSQYSSPGGVSVSVQAPSLGPTALNVSGLYRRTIPPPNAVTPVITIPVNATDPYGYPLTITSVTDGRYGTPTWSGLTVTYTYNTSVVSGGPGVTTHDSLTYTVSDGHGRTASAQLEANVLVFTRQ